MIGLSVRDLLTIERINFFKFCFRNISDVGLWVSETDVVEDKSSKIGHEVLNDNIE